MNINTNINIGIGVNNDITGILGSKSEENKNNINHSNSNNFNNNNVYGNNNNINEIVVGDGNDNNSVNFNFNNNNFNGFTVQLLVRTLLDMREHHTSVAKKQLFQNRQIRNNDPDFLQLFNEISLNDSNDNYDNNYIDANNNCNYNKNNSLEINENETFNEKLLRFQLQNQQSLNIKISNIMDSDIGPHSTAVKKIEKTGEK